MKFGRLAIAIALACSAASAEQQAEGHEPSIEAELRRITQELMDALAPGDVEIWRRYLHDDAVYLDENGVVYDKASLLRELEPLPAGLVGRIEVDRFKLTLHGDTAVVAAEIQEYLDYHGQQLRTRFRFLDTWLRARDGWRLIARHTAAVLKDPPAIQLPLEELCAHAGVYQLTPSITTTVRCTPDGLISERTGRPAATYLPELGGVFFIPGQPRTRRIFERDAQGRVVGFVDRREGEDVRWPRIADAPADAGEPPSDE